MQRTSFIAPVSSDSLSYTTFTPDRFSEGTSNPSTSGPTYFRTDSWFVYAFLKLNLQLRVAQFCPLILSMSHQTDLADSLWLAFWPVTLLASTQQKTEVDQAGTFILRQTLEAESYQLKVVQSLTSTYNLQGLVHQKIGDIFIGGAKFGRHRKFITENYPASAFILSAFVFQNQLSFTQLWKLQSSSWMEGVGVWFLRPTSLRSSLI